jgi:hypothetical protein
MGQSKEALRASVETGPRAALTRRGAQGVPEPGENHERVWGNVFSLLREPMRWGQLALVTGLEGTYHQDEWKNGAKMPRIPS